MDRDKITELLKNYRLYKLAIRDYERPEPQGSHNRITERYFEASPCRIVAYSDMPMGTGSGSRPPKITGLWAWEDNVEYHAFKYAVRRVEDALDLLSDDERSVVTLKWMDDLTLDEVGRRKNYSREWVKKVHRRALSKLCICLRFDEAPKMGTEHQPVA